MKSLYTVILVLSISFASCDNSTNTPPRKPANKAELVTEIRKAMKAHGNDVDLNYIDTSVIKDMEDLFASDLPSTDAIVEGYGLSEFAGDISKWNVSKVTNMSHMFAGATAFNSDISKWDVSSVINMSGMFNRATAFNKDISKWDVSSVADMGGMFSRATAFKQNLNAWGSRLNDRIKANNWFTTSAMFSGSGLATNLPNWCDTVPECQKQQE